MMALLLRLTPSKIGWPRPPAPSRAAKVAVPTLMTADVLTPARIVGRAIGRYTFRSRAHGSRPSASADSFKEGGIVEIPTAVFRMIGKSEYRNSAAMAVFSVRPKKGMGTRSVNKARE